MNISILGKALLELYKYLVPITESIDKIIKTKTYNFDVSCTRNMEMLSGEIIELTQKKIALINIKVLIDKSIARLSEKNKKIIILRYLDGMEMNDITSLLDISVRTYFRKCANAYAAFVNMLQLENSLNGDMLDSLQKNRWFNSLISNFDESAKNTENTFSLCHRLLGDIKKVG